uniref:Protein Lines n=1 Tax=Anthurium amnicola TaxID=1678845 RepID=A0A1D1ZB79_9ARAE
MADDGGSKGCSRLCGLVGRSLRQHAAAVAPRGLADEPSLSSSTEEAAGAPPTLSKGMEKDLLISLTLVRREIKKWTMEVDCDFEQSNVLDPTFHCDCSWHMEPPFEYQRCSANIISLLMPFATSSSPYVRHMAGKVLVDISNFLVQYEKKWEEFIHLLWISLQVAINSCASLSTSDESVVPSVLHCCDNRDEASPTTECSDVDAQFVALLLSRLRSSHGLISADLIHVLQTIWKSLKNEDGDLAQSYLHLAVFSLLKMPWDLLSNICPAQTGGSCITQNVVGGKFGIVESNGVFFGAVLQLLCSLVEPNNLEVLMIRLSFWSHWQCSAVVSWIQLLQRYFKDLLHQSISRSHAGHDISIEGSPFLASVTDEGKICTPHLQRQTIFLFLKCCFTLIRFGDQACHECKCGPVALFPCEPQKHGGICFFNGSSELSGWLQKHILLENCADYVNYPKSCSRFSLTFLQLYIDEDDLLFEMLLQLLDAPFPTVRGRKNDRHDNLSAEMGKDISVHVLNIFNPIHLFHLFLALLHYDHLVLLDYLISKDTGIHFIQYLLRCLRLVCKSWSAFVEFSICSTETDSPSKRRTEDSTMHKFGSKQESSAMQQQTFQDAKECLLSLKTSVEDLHMKKLFPYSPGALLRSFTKFQELCDGELQG